MDKITNMSFRLKMDRPIDRKRHYISPGEYEIEFGNGDSFAFDFYESAASVCKDDQYSIEFEMRHLDRTMFEEESAEEDEKRFASDLVNVRIAAFPQFFVYCGDEEDEEIHPVSVRSISFDLYDMDTDEYKTVKVPANVCRQIKPED